MISSVKKLKDLETVFSKDNNILISEAIGLLREEQPFKGAIGLLISFYNGTDDFSIRKAIEGFMNDLKDQSASEEVIHEIRKKWNADTISMLVSSCWQSGLDYSDYSPDFAKIFLEGDYVTAIECLTVIEESVHKLSTMKKNEIIKIIRENQIQPSGEKRELFLEFLAILGEET
jgi:hypothetical protein